MEPCIEIDSLTRDYCGGRGIFDISLSVGRGECFGFCGINGAGKTTTIRHLMGFLRPLEGTATINGRDCWRDARDIKRMVGYVPGEINFPDVGSGTEFLRLQMDRAGQDDTAYCDYVCDRLQLDATAPLKRMSKGMKQKTALAAAFMAKPDILIMDEPTTGLDPLMRDRFLELLGERVDAGCTVFMSSHVFDEMERACDRVALIRDGHIADVKDVDDIRHSKVKEYRIELESDEGYRQALALPFGKRSEEPDKRQLSFIVENERAGALMRALRELDVKWIKETKHTLEGYFRGVLEKGEGSDVL